MVKKHPLTAYREKHDFSLEQLGDFLGGIHKSTVHRWEQGRKIPAERVAFVSQATGISKSALRPDLFGLTGRKPEFAA